MLGLEPGIGMKLLGRVWLGAGVGVLHSLLSPLNRKSKVVSALVYVALGWAVLPYAGQLRQALSPAATGLVVAGGVIYSLGAAVYAARWPNPFPRVWGYHEIFHLLIIVAALLHFFAVRSVVRRLAGLP
jgi:hemolysin III